MDSTKLTSSILAFICFITTHSTATPQQFTPGQSWDPVGWDYLTDLDGDGLEDLAEVTGASRLRVAWGSAPGVWTFPTSEYWFPPQAASGAGHDCVDWDGDGDLDFVACNWHRDIWWVENLGAREFETHVNLTGTEFYSPVGLEVDDLDADGDLDIALLSYYGGGAALFQDNGHFTSIALPGGAGAASDQIRVGDLDGNGLLDVTFQSSGLLYLYSQVSPGVFGATQTASEGAAGVFDVLDLDANGELDLLVVASCSGAPKAGASLNPATSGLNQLCQPNWGGSTPIAADFNLDGVLDLVTTEPSGSSLFLGTGPLTFGPPQALGFTARFASDADGDGDIDLIGSNGILLNQQFGPEWIQSPVNGHWYSMTAATSWTDAESTATSWGGNLATVLSDEENNWIRSTFTFGRAWIGYHDSNLEGTFEWSSGATSGYENWSPGSPGGLADDQDYVVIESAGGFWEDRFSTSNYHGIVQAPPQDCNANEVPDSYELVGDPYPSLDWNGDGLLDECSSIGFCTPTANSASTSGGYLEFEGSPVLAAGEFILSARDLPPLQWSLFVMSRATSSPYPLPGSQGVLCLDAPLIRLNRPGHNEIDVISSDGTRTLLVETAVPVQGQLLLPGETWHFQLWFRDQNPSATSNTTNGVSVLFR